MVVVNHTYKEIGMFPKDIVGGGTGSYYSAFFYWLLWIATLVFNHITFHRLLNSTSLVTFLVI